VYLFEGSCGGGGVKPCTTYMKKEEGLADGQRIFYGWLTEGI